MDLQQVEARRGYEILINFAAHVNAAPLEGRLFNIDPVSGTVVVLDDDNLRVVPGSSVASIQVYEDQDEDQAAEFIKRAEDRLDLRLTDLIRAASNQERSD